MDPPNPSAGRFAARNRATKSAELQAELATGTLRNAPERSGTLRNAPERSGRIWGPKSAELQAELATGTLRNAPAGFGAPNRLIFRWKQALKSPKR